ncbi:MAG: glutathione-disulfide reductase, partial [Hyphomicrobiaceae bacterium]|nr:glutathione-disulfide reductase [Hyphomicrobiaceae bacterium]
GARVAIAEEYRVGGTCVIRGCVPKKLLVYASRFPEEFADAAAFGWSVPEPVFDWAKLIANKDKEIARLEAAYRGTLARNNVTLIESRAVVEAPGRLYLSRTGETVTASVILVATGARPYLDPAIPGIEHAITSNEAFDLKRLPQRIVIAGGGYIAVEFAGIFRGLGSEVTLVHRGDKLLRGFDEDVRDDLMAAYRAHGIDLKLGCKMTSIARSGERRVVSLTDGSEIAADAVMVATGRVPNTDALGLERAGVVLGANGRVVVDADSRTSVSSIYAVGDVTDRLSLTPVAIREGHAFADYLFGSKTWSAEYDMVPTGVFSTPEIGTVGMAEDAARRAFGNIDIYKSRFRPMKAAMAGRNDRTLMKLVVDGATGRVLGCHVLGHDAGEIVQMAAIAMKMGATKADFDRTMALHPSASEELVTMREKWTPPAV